jgi:hypothetical protein
MSTATTIAVTNVIFVILRSRARAV